MPARPLRDEQFADVAKAVISLSSEAGLEGWRIADVVAATGVSSRTLYKYFPSKEYLLLKSVLARSEFGFADLLDGNGSRMPPRPPPDNGHRWDDTAPGALERRVQAVLAPITTQVLGLPVLTKAVVHALTSGKPGVAPVLLEFSDTMREAIALAIADGEPTDRDLMAAEAVQLVWFAALVGWACDVGQPEDFSAAVLPALALIQGTS